MKIGIITLPFHTNYGGILQGFALQKVANNLGHDAITIYQAPKRYPFYRSILRLPVRLFKRFLLKQNVPLLPEKNHNAYVKRENLRRHFTNKFINKHIHTRIIRSFTEIKKFEYGGFIVGSDQIWRPKYIRPFLFDAFLQFARNWDVIRCAYSASFGSDQWEMSTNETEHCKKLLQLFKGVSVREESGVAFVKKYFDRNAEWLIDPTLLIDASVYFNLFAQASPSPAKGKDFIYILDSTPESIQLRDTFIEQTTHKTYNLSLLKEEAPLPVETWLQCIKEANTIVTDSFHVCVFSIIFKKQFFVIANPSRGISRLNSLFHKFGIENRVLDRETINSIKDFQPINYNLIQPILEHEREKAFAFLQQNLNID